MCTLYGVGSVTQFKRKKKDINKETEYPNIIHCIEICVYLEGLTLCCYLWGR
jgi:hypothetical protein